MENWIEYITPFNVAYKSIREYEKYNNSTKMTINDTEILNAYWIYLDLEFSFLLPPEENPFFT